VRVSPGKADAPGTLEAMRVVGGRTRGRRLKSPPGRDVRPTADRVREAVFDVLASMGAIEGAAVVDLFAGSGALAIEALSRGAARATLVERDPSALEAIRSNLENTGFTSSAQVVASDVHTWLRRRGSVAADVVFCDPPYGFEEWQDVVGRLVAPVLVLESDREVNAPVGWNVLRARRYGTTVVTVLEPVARVSRKGGV
jgi:16S rRNA (guanine966-N2)-methyltransferase